jgi:hypothetical protein
LRPRKLRRGKPCLVFLGSGNGRMKGDVREGRVKGLLRGMKHGSLLEGRMLASWDHGKK